jgi:hypothetical protein
MMAPWPDVEVVVIAGLRGHGVDARAELDNNLLGELPVVQVTRVGGDDDGLRLDRALIDVDAYAATRAAAAAMSGLVRGYLLDELRGSATDTAVIGRIRTVSAPSWRPYENTGLRRNGATYEVFFHPVS